MRTFFVALTLTAAAAATTALDQYDSNNATYNNIIDYSSFEGVYHHQERKLSNLFSDDDDEQDDHIALNIFDDVDTGDEEGQRNSMRKKNSKEWKCRVDKRVKKCRKGKVERWTKKKKQKCCRNWPPSKPKPKPQQRPTKRPRKTRKPSKPKPKPQQRPVSLCSSDNIVVL